MKLHENQGNTADDLKFWKWALKIIQRYGAGGMSSDESDSGAQQLNGPNVVYRVKILAWRKRIDDLLDTINGTRHAGTAIFSLQGSTGIKRSRPSSDQSSGSWPESRRPPKRYLPYCFYDEDWFNEVAPEVRQATLHCTAEEFIWIQSFRGSL